MHPLDEAALIRELLRDPAIVLIDGSRWKSATPPTTRNVSAIGRYCLIWSPEDLAELAADFIPTCNDWYCRAEHATISILEMLGDRHGDNGGPPCNFDRHWKDQDRSERRASVQVARSCD